MVRVIYLLNQGLVRREALIKSVISGQHWCQVGDRVKVTDREMVDLNCSKARFTRWSKSEGLEIL